MRIGAGVLDPARGAPGPRTLAERLVRAEWPQVEGRVREAGMSLAPLERVELQLTPREGHLHTELGVVMSDGAGITVRARLILGARAGALTATLSDVHTAPNTALVKKAREAALRHPLGAAFNVLTLGLGASIVEDEGESELRKQVQSDVGGHAEKVAQLISQRLVALRQLASPVGGRLADRIRVDTAEAPLVTPAGITLYPCLSAVIAQSRLVGIELPGFPFTVAPRPPTGVVGVEDMELLVGANGMNQSLFVAWRTGMLRSVGEHLLSSLGKNTLLESLAFEVSGVEPLLPPYVAGAGDGAGTLSVRATNLKLGHWVSPAGEPRDVMGHATFDGTLTTTGESVRLLGTIREVHANCAQRRTDGWLLTPCLGDLVPSARIELADAPVEVSIDTGPWFRRMRAGGFEGVAVNASDLHVRVEGAEVRARARVKLEAAPFSAR